MSDTTTTTDEATETEPTTFGIDVAEAERTYREELDEAEKTYQALVGDVNEKLNAAHSAVYTLLGDDQYTAASHINGLLSTLSQKDRNDRLDAARTARTALVEAATKKRDEVLEKDPFTKRVATVVKRQYGEQYADTLLQNAPYTFESLRGLANSQGWCSDYEDVMGGFVRADVLPDETRVVTRKVAAHVVPSSENPKTGQEWEARLTLPAYVRDADRYGNPYSYYDLSDYATSTEYVLVKDVEPAEETESAEDTDF